MEKMMADEKMQREQQEPSQNGKNANTSRTIIIIIVSIVLGLIFVLCIRIVLRMRQQRKLEEKLGTDNDKCLQYDFGTIRAAMDNFSDANKLGQGGFGIVYRVTIRKIVSIDTEGELPNGQEIAVKRLSRDSGQGDLEFKNEVLLGARLQHRNLVSLLGFSLEKSERILVYEFMQNGSLDHFIFDPIKRPYLDWDRRYKIIRGVARGVLYIHEDSRVRIIHLDLKASNILLDGDNNPKISDFGMARLFVEDETQGNASKIGGTPGYMAPKYAMHGHFSVKSDVFSFGVLVLEIITGQRINSYQNGNRVKSLLNFAWKNWHEGTTTNLIDPALGASSTSLQDIVRCLHIGLLCVQESAADRPTMAMLVVMLSIFSLNLPTPSQPAFFMSSPDISSSTI
ncbi:receptor kinase At4g00960 [Olea europaea subsp. europaea]|uniref:Receptor kinase At4g00960 n=1 Tax=Olea europaea subsp. europaea TaxID=158383 RepID=A0A8S0UKS5_OLEEU|nr:receptor kinase At4g00960 [Olea europaea subsp. europaea]